MRSPDFGHAQFKTERRNAVKQAAKKTGLLNLTGQGKGTKADLAKKRWRKANPEKDKAQREAAQAIMAAKRIALKREVYEYKAVNPCACGEADPVCLDFDHRDPKAKLFSIPYAVNKPLSREIVFAEIAKCDIRCANCHRRKTAVDMGYYSFMEKSDG